MDNETNETPVVETNVEAVADTEASVKPVRKRLDDIEFFTVNEDIANGDTPTIAAIAEATGLTTSSVTQRRLKFKKDYKDCDPPIVLTELPRGTTKTPIAETHASIMAVIAERAAKKAEADALVELEADAS